MKSLQKIISFPVTAFTIIISEGVIEALDRKTNTITFELLEQAMMDEFKKTGRKCEICTDEMVMQNPAKKFGTGYEHRKNF